MHCIVNGVDVDPGPVTTDEVVHHPCRSTQKDREDSIITLTDNDAQAEPVIDLLTSETRIFV